MNYWIRVGIKLGIFGVIYLLLWNWGVGSPEKKDFYSEELGYTVGYWMTGFWIFISLTLSFIPSRHWQSESETFEESVLKEIREINQKIS